MHAFSLGLFKMISSFTFTDRTKLTIQLHFALFSLYKAEFYLNFVENVYILNLFKYFFFCFHTYFDVTIFLSRKCIEYLYESSVSESTIWFLYKMPFVSAS